MLATLKREWDALFGQPEPDPDEKLLRRRDKKIRSLREHRQSFFATNGFLAALWFVIAVTTGAWFPWFLFPFLGWGLGLTMHALSTRNWLEDHRGELAAAQQRLGIAAPPEREEERWKALRRRCEAAVHRAHEAVSGSLSDDALHERLQEGLEQTLSLLDGAERLDRALTKMHPDGGKSLQAELARIESAWSEATDEGLRELHAQNRAMLQARRRKLESTVAERERIAATVEGFIIAADNLQLDALRLGDGVAPPAALADPVRRIQDELEVLEKVRGELASLESHREG